MDRLMLTTQHMRKALNRKLKVVVSREILSPFYSDPLGMNEETFELRGGEKQAC